VSSSFAFKTINLRGFGGTSAVRSLQIIDGVDNAAPGLNFPVGNLVGVNDLDLQSVEIISGAASGLYGASALQGVINMQSKNPFDYQGFSAMIKGGATQDLQGIMKVSSATHKPLVKTKNGRSK
jgi:iron complex outermembrane receptor protein